EIPSVKRREELRRELAKSLNPELPDVSSILNPEGASLLLNPADRNDSRIDANSEEDVVECESDFSGDSIDAEPERVTSHDQCLPPSSSIAELDDLISELPATYSSFATYCDFYTNSVDGTVQPAEWRISPVSFTE